MSWLRNSRKQKILKLSLFIPIEPISCPRPRFNTITGQTFKTQKYKEFLEEVYCLVRRTVHIKPISDLIIIEKLIFHMPIPKSTSKKKKELMLNKYCDNNMDLDNMQKAIFDALNELLYIDDKQIVEINNCKKIYSDKVGIDITIVTTSL
jgi:Holliday junction resolvase RusA-like endonuclease